MKQLFRVFMALFAMFVFLDVRAEDYITTNADKALADKLMEQMHSVMMQKTVGEWSPYEGNDAKNSW